MNLRDLLLRLGVSHMNATIIIQYMMMNPAGSDPAAPSLSLLIMHLQQALQQVGASGVTVNGRIDDATNAALERLLPGWLFQPWSRAVKAVVDFRDHGGQLTAGPVTVGARPMSGMPLGLPDVPGGVLTYLAAGAVAWHFWKRR